jgi:WD40 repeat protein
MVTVHGAPAIGLNEAIARVRDASGRVVGVGFLVGAREIVTCAHVVEKVLGNPDQAPVASAAEVAVDFPLVAPGQMCSATVVVWHPARADGTGDIAGLRLTSAPPQSVKPARLVIAADLWEHSFRTFGFPARHDDGVWASGRLLGRQGTGWVQLEDVKETGFRIERGFSGAPVWDDELQGVVGMAVAAEARDEIRAGYLTPAEALIRAWPELATQALPPCPYRGLFAFREQDAALFFGREDLTDRLVEQLTRKPLVAVVGPSGSGKSSLVFAGAIPQVRQREGWVVASLRPTAGTSPFAALAAALLPLLEPRMTEVDRFRELPKLAETLAEGRLVEVADRALERAGARRLLLVVDQFEELYAQTPAAAQQFVDVLVQAVTAQRQRGSPALVTVLTLRADFLGQALGHAGLAQALEGSVLVIGRMSHEQLQRAISGPAGHEVTYEAGLVDRILDDVGGEPGNLPLLEFALTLLWERQERRTLTHAAYESLGGVTGALAGHAEQVYLDEFPESEREAARRVFVQLVQPGETTEPTRRVAHRTELDEVRWRLAQRLASTRLVVTGRDAAGVETVEVVHEALISEWERLRQWVAADQAFRIWQERLRGAVSQWDSSGRDAGALLRGVPLAEAERWLTQRPDDLSPTEQGFIEASRAFQGRTLRRLRGLAAGLAALVVVAATLGVLAVQWGRRADRQSRLAETQSRLADKQRGLASSRYLVAEADDRQGRQADLSMLLSVAAFRMADTPQARDSLIRQVSLHRDVQTLLAGHTAAVDSVAFSPDGQMLASGGGNQIILWDVARRARLGQPLTGHRGRVGTLAFSPDGQMLASGGGNQIILWDVARRARLGQPLTGYKSAVRAVAFSHDGRVLASGGDDGIVLWDVARRTRLGTMARSQQGSPITSVAFSRDGLMLASTSEFSYVSEEGGEAVVWDVARRARLGTVSPGPSRVGRAEKVYFTNVVFHADGRTLIGATDEGRVVLWDTARRTRSGLLTIDVGDDTSSVALDRNGRTLAFLPATDVAVYLFDMARRTPKWTFSHTGEIRSIALSPDGKTLAVGGADNTVTLSDVMHPGALAGHAEWLAAFALSPDGRTLATGGGDKKIVLWDVARRTPRGPPLTGHIGSPSTLAFSHDGRVLASADGPLEKAPSPRQTNHIILWDPNRRIQRDRIVAGHGNTFVASMAFSPDDRILASSTIKWTADATVDRTVNGTIILWDATQGSRLATLRGLNGPVAGMVFSPDGRTLAVASDDITLWDVARRTRLATVLRGLRGGGGFYDEGGTAVAFSPDGQILAASSGREVILWNVARRTRLATLTGTGQVAFSPDGRTLAAEESPISPNEPPTIGLWDIAQHTRLATLPQSVAPAFSPDGHLLAADAVTGAVVLWNLDPASWVHQLCGMVGRDLTTAEWREFLPEQKYRKVCGS